ncbi:MAG TPA: DegQ family serine endoprotease [Pyrinomonadaceae bacterium]|jgi:Do/DeqQ family serine protease|nr:DegQ family serine endoprotease [Pyrinomonadaceae bacterium]
MKDVTNFYRGATSRLNVLLSFLLVVVAFASCSGQSKLMSLTPAGSAPAAPATTSVAGVQTSYADLVSRVAPAVVTIRSTERSRPAQQFPFMDDPNFRDFFGDRMPQQQQQPPQRVQGVGSGVIVNSEGYILTNHHVVDGAIEVKVELTDNRTFTAKLVGSDPPSDLAVLKIDAKDLPTLSLGDSDKVRVGDAVLAVGNPLGIGQTVTSGIVSAKGRATGLSDGSFEDFLQTDAAINRGNSGGALVNTNGELIGINSQILSPSGGNIGIGFAIPSNMAKAVMDQLMKTGKVRRGMLGVTIQSVDADLASSLNLPAARGAIVTSVANGGPAEKAGLKRGDVILAINKQPVIDNNSLRNLVASMPPGSNVEVSATRNGRDQNFEVALAELPDRERPASDAEDTSTSDTGNTKFGLTVQPLTAETSSRYGLDADDQGLLVTRVDPSGSAADAGIRQGDLIQEVNRQTVKTVAEFSGALRQSGAKPALVLIKRRNNEIYLTLKANS